MTVGICRSCGHGNVHWPTCDEVDRFFDAEHERLEQLQIAVGFLQSIDKRHARVLMRRLRTAGLVLRPTIKVIDPETMVGSTFARVELGPEDRNKVPPGVLP